MSYRMPDSRVCSIMFPLGSNIWPPVTSYSFSSVTQNNKTSYRSTPVPIIKNVPSVPYKNSYQTRSTTLRSLSGVESYLFLSFIIAVHFHFAIKSFKHSKTSIYFKNTKRNGPFRALAEGGMTFYSSFWTRKPSKKQLVWKLFVNWPFLMN